MPSTSYWLFGGSNRTKGAKDGKPAADHDDKKPLKGDDEPKEVTVDKGKAKDEEVAGPTGYVSFGSPPPDPLEEKEKKTD